MACLPGRPGMSGALRVFLLTWDPLDWLGSRPDGFAAVSAGPPGLELAVYAPVWSVLEQAAVNRLVKLVYRTAFGLTNVTNQQRRSRYAACRSTRPEWLHAVTTATSQPVAT